MQFTLYISPNGITNKAQVREVFSSLKEGKYLVRVDGFKKRSLYQNAYYHGVVVPLVKDGLRDAGYDEVKTNEDAHEVIKHLFLKRRITSKSNGDEIVIAGSTTTLTTVEFNAYLEEIWKWAAEYLGVQIPQPNEQLVMFDEPMVAEYDNDVNAIIVK